MDGVGGPSRTVRGRPDLLSDPAFSRQDIFGDGALRETAVGHSLCWCSAAVRAVSSSSATGVMRMNAPSAPSREQALRGCDKTEVSLFSLNWQAGRIGERQPTSTRQNG